MGGKRRSRWKRLHLQERRRLQRRKAAILVSLGVVLVSQHRSRDVLVASLRPVDALLRRATTLLRGAAPVRRWLHHLTPRTAGASEEPVLGLLRVAASQLRHRYVTCTPVWCVVCGPGCRSGSSLYIYRVYLLSNLLTESVSKEGK